MFKIDRPGIYRGISEAEYRMDPCPTPSLTQSLCKIILSGSPKHAWTESPRLNPAFEPDDDPKFDVGNAAHRLILHRGKDFLIIRAADWRTAAAKEEREKAAAEGLIGILEHQFNQASDMAEASRLQLRMHQDRDAFDDGDAEVMIAWEEDGIWFRALIDWLHTDLRTMDDYKSTAMSVADHCIGQRALGGLWHLQAAFIERGLDVLDPDGAGRRKFRFIAQENYKPHALNVMHMNEHWMTMGRKHVEAALSKWRPAVTSNRWTGYGTRPVTPEYPAFHERQWLERELSGEFEQDPSLIFAG
jgi:PDDEXK-like uncharacterized protein DUF3799